MRILNWKLLLALGAVAIAGQQAHAVVKNDGAKQVRGMGPKTEAMPGEFVVRLKRDGSLKLQSAMRLFAAQGMKIAQTVNADEQIYLVKSQKQIKATDLSLQSADKATLAQIQSMEGVERAEPNFVYRAYETIPAGARFSELWGMKNTGQNNSEGTAGKAGADIKATMAWDLHKGSDKVVVAVIDTGVDYNHPDLKDNMWTNPRNPGTHGYNAITGSLDPMDDNEHGTHCSGTIGSSNAAGTGVAGVSWKVQIMGVKFLSGSGSGTLADAIKAIDWATANGAQIMSNSWGGGGYSEELKASIERAKAKGILFVAAAGNDASNNDSRPAYPASYELDNVVSVAAGTNLDTKADFSNYGQRTVHVMAPGHKILSTTPGNTYSVFSGTSMACPHVSGGAALLLASEPNLTYAQVKERIMRTSDKLKPMRTRLISGGRMNVYNMLADITPPGFITIPDSAWFAPIMQSISSAHPYTDNARGSWTINKPGARFLRIRFARFETEAGYDFVTVKTAAGEVVEQLSGTLARNYTTMEIEGDTAKIEWSTDTSVVGYGFDIDAFQWTDFRGQSGQEAVAIKSN